GSSDFSPRSVPGLGLWVASDAGIGGDSAGRVSVWRDLSGLGNDLTQATLASQPVMVPGAQNGLPVLRFDGSSDWMQFTSRFDGTIRGVFAVLRENPLSTWRTFLGDSSTFHFYPGWQTWWTGGYASPFVTGGQFSVNGAVVDGTTTNRPTSMSVVSLVTTGGVSADRLFWSPQGNAPWIGDIAELIVYTQPLTSFQRKAVEDYLALKYGLYTSYPWTVGAPRITPGSSVFETSVTVSVDSPTPGAEIR